jgi:hypothetical protein
LLKQICRHERSSSSITECGFQIADFEAPSSDHSEI